MNVSLTRSVVAGLLTAAITLGCSKADPTPEGAAGGAAVPANPPTVAALPQPTSAALVGMPTKSAAEVGAAATPEGGTTPTPGPVRTYVVVPGETTARYTVKEEFFDGALQRLGKALGMTTTIGTTQVVSGQVLVGGERGWAPTSVGGEITVDLSTLTSDEQGRDNRIRERWLESGTYPQAKFVPTAIGGFPEMYTEGTPILFTLTGNLTIRDVSKTLAWQVTATESADKLSGQAMTTIKMTDFGFDPPDMMGMFKVEDAVQIVLDFVLQG